MLFLFFFLFYTCFTVELPPKQLSDTSRIVGGTPIVNSKYPWIVSLRFEYIDSNGFWTVDTSHNCGGSIISDPSVYPVIVLTAAHCIEDLDATISNSVNFYETNYPSGDWSGYLAADIGRTDISNEFDNAGNFDTIKVIEYYNHPFYNGTSYENGM